MLDHRETISSGISNVRNFENLHKTRANRFAKRGMSHVLVVSWHRGPICVRGRDSQYQPNPLIGTFSLR